jgi:hypothetical protein
LRLLSAGSSLLPPLTCRGGVLCGLGFGQHRLSKSESAPAAGTAGTDSCGNPFVPIRSDLAHLSDPSWYQAFLLNYGQQVTCSPGVTSAPNWRQRLGMIFAVELPGRADRRASCSACRAAPLAAGRDGVVLALACFAAAPGCTGPPLSTEESLGVRRRSSPARRHRPWPRRRRGPDPAAEAEARDTGWRRHRLEQRGGPRIRPHGLASLLALQVEIRQPGGRRSAIATASSHRSRGVLASPELGPSSSSARSSSSRRTAAAPRRPSLCRG